MVKDTSELIKRVSYLFTPLTSSSKSGNLISYKGSFILSARTVLRSFRWYFLDSLNIISLVLTT
jgi:hypothetical protein